MSKKGKCRIDSDECVTLVSILEAFQVVGIKEEQAWAIIHQACIALEHQLSSESEDDKTNEDVNIDAILNQLATQTSLNVFIKQDGKVDAKSWNIKCFPKNSSLIIKKIVGLLGCAVFLALDFGCEHDEQVELERCLEELIDIMTDGISNGYGNADDHAEEDSDSEKNIDEGIQEDEASQQSSSSCSSIKKSSCNSLSGIELLQLVINHCHLHACEHDNIDDHYRNVCRALVAEGLQLSTFLTQVSKGSEEALASANIEHSQEMEHIHVQAWARVWMSVMGQLRKGVTLRAVDCENYSRQRKEYELTPFEMLLDDIKNKRYRFKKVGERKRSVSAVFLSKKVDVNVEQVILNHIRAPPPLRPASKRQLKPLSPKEPTLHEKLMAGIKSEHKLKPTPPMARKVMPIKQSKQRRQLSIIPERRQSLDDTAVNINYIDQEDEFSYSNQSIIPSLPIIFERFSFRNLSLRKFATFERVESMNNIPIASLAIEESMKMKKAKSSRSSWLKSLRFW